MRIVLISDLVVIFHMWNSFLCVCTRYRSRISKHVQSISAGKFLILLRSFGRKRFSPRFPVLLILILCVNRIKFCVERCGLVEWERLRKFEICFETTHFGCGCVMFFCVKFLEFVGVSFSKYWGKNFGKFCSLNFFFKFNFLIFFLNFSWKITLHLHSRKNIKYFWGFWTKIYTLAEIPKKLRNFA